MALSDVLLFAARSWPHLRERIPAEQMPAIQRQLAAAVHGAPWDPAELVQLLLAREAAESEGWRLLEERPVRRGATLEAPLLVTAAAELRYRIEQDAWSTVMAEWSEPADPEQVERVAEERLWTVPMREPPEGAEPALLVVLEHEGERRAPAFQFVDEHSLALAPGVEEVNRLLDVLEDPWGAASWWLTPHAALHAIPADALRAGGAEVVTAAARAVGEPEPAAPGAPA